MTNKVRFTKEELDCEIRTLCEQMGIKAEEEHFDIVRAFLDKHTNMIDRRPKNFKSYGNLLNV